MNPCVAKERGGCELRRSGGDEKRECDNRSSVLRLKADNVFGSSQYLEYLPLRSSSRTPFRPRFGTRARQWL